MLRLLRLVSVPQLRSSWGRTLLVIAGTLTGVALIVGINVINTTVTASLRETLAAIAGPSDLEVTLGLGEIGFPEATLTTVKAVPGVRTAVALVRGTISLADHPAETLYLFGADLTAEVDLARYRIDALANRRDLLKALEDPHGLFVSELLAEELGLRVGETIRLSTPKGVDTFTVHGLLRTEGLAKAFGGRLAVMDLAAAQRQLGKEDRVDQIDVVLEADASPAVISDRLTAALPPTLSVAPPAQRAVQYQAILASFQAMLTGLSLLCLVAGLFIIYNTTATGALHRAVVMAGLRRIGATPGQIFLLLMTEALILGTVGTAFGIATGIALGHLLTTMVTDSMGVIFQLRFIANTLTVDWRQLATIGCVGIATTLLASAFAAHRVAQLEPLAVMRTGAGPSHPEPHPIRFVAAWAILVIVSAAALVLEQRYKSIAWGNIGATLWNGSAIVIVIPLVTWVRRGMTAMLVRLFGIEGAIAANSLFRSTTRTGVTIAAIALVLTVGMTVASLAHSFHRTTATYVQGFLAGDLIVSAVATEGGWLETPLPATILAELATIPGVERVDAVRVLPGQMFRGERIAVGAASDIFMDPNRFPAGWYREGDPAHAAEAVRSGHAVNVSTSLADRWGLHVGDLVALDTPTGTLALPIAGVVPDLLSDRGSVLLTRRLLLERWHESSVNRVNLMVTPGEPLDMVRRRIVDRFGDRYRLKVLSMRDVIAYHENKVNSAFAFTDAIQLLIVIVTIAGIFDLLLSAIIERRGELARWRLIGADDRSVMRSILVESFSVGALGAALGVVVGVVTAWMWIGVNFRHLLGYQLELHLAIGATLWYVALVVGMTLVAGFLAGRHAIRQPLLAALRAE